MPRWPRKPVRWWAYNLLQLALYLGLASLPIVLEKWDQLSPEGGGERSDSRVILSLPFPYSWFTHPGFAENQPQVVQLVTYSEKESGGEFVNESCRRRKLLTRIIQAIQTQRVSLVVLDFSFAPTPCDVNPQLEHAMRTSSVPLVIGLRSEDADEQGGSSLQLSDAMIRDDTDVVKRGVLKLNRDARKIPLEWPIQVSPQQKEARIENLPTLSLVAATQFITIKYGSPERISRRLSQQVASGIHPYASFMPSGSIPKTSALKLLCGEHQAKHWENCSLPREQRLHGMPIVVVGEESLRDEHYLPEGAIGAEPVSKTVYGVWLQANYIENLVQGNYLKAAPNAWIWVINFVWLILVELSFRFRKPIKAFVMALSISILFSLLVYFVALQWG